MRLTPAAQTRDISNDTVHTLVQHGIVTGPMTSDNTPILPYDSCEHAKTTRKPTRKGQKNWYGSPLRLRGVGPLSCAESGGPQILLSPSHTDNHTRCTRITLLRTKDELLEAYKAFAACAEEQHGACIKPCRSDRGDEFTGAEFDKFFKGQGMVCRLTTYDTPQHNGVAESSVPALFSTTAAFPKAV